MKKLILCILLGLFLVACKRNKSIILPPIQLMVETSNNTLTANGSDIITVHAVVDAFSVQGKSVGFTTTGGKFITNNSTEIMHEIVNEDTLMTRLQVGRISGNFTIKVAVEGTNYSADTTLFLAEPTFENEVSITYDPATDIPEADNTSMVSVEIDAPLLKNTSLEIDAFQGDLSWVSTASQSISGNTITVPLDPNGKRTIYFKVGVQPMEYIFIVEEANTDRSFSSSYAVGRALPGQVHIQRDLPDSLSFSTVTPSFSFQITGILFRTNGTVSAGTALTAQAFQNGDLVGLFVNSSIRTDGVGDPQFEFYPKQGNSITTPTTSDSLKFVVETENGLRDSAYVRITP